MVLWLSIIQSAYTGFLCSLSFSLMTPPRRSGNGGNCGGRGNRGRPSFARPCGALYRQLRSHLQGTWRGVSLAMPWKQPGSSAKVRTTAMKHGGREIWWHYDRYFLVVLLDRQGHIVTYSVFLNEYTYMTCQSWVGRCWCRNFGQPISSGKIWISQFNPFLQERIAIKFCISSCAIFFCGLFSLFHRYKMGWSEK